MSNVAVFLPFVSLILFAGIIFAMYIVRKYITVKITHWLLIIYTGVLVLSMALVSFIPKESQTTVVLGEEEQALNEFYQAIHKGEISLLDSKYLIKETSFEYEDSLLSIEVNREHGSMVFVERTNDDKNIEARVYGFGPYINGMDFTDKVLPLHLNLNGDTLEIVYPSYQEIKLSMVKQEFTINQFTKNSDFFGNTITHDEQVVYLRIPENLEIQENPNIALQYVRE